MSMKSHVARHGPPPVWAWAVAVVAGAFLANSIPHGVMGITGQAFPTPFSGGPPDLSPPWLNVLWSATNLAIFYVLWRLLGRARRLRAIRLVIAAAGALAALGLAWIFTGVVGGGAA